MKKISKLLFLLLTLFFISPAIGQEVSISTINITKEHSSVSLDNLEYQLSDDNIAYFNNGSNIAVKLQVTKDLAKKGNYIYLSYALIDTIEVWTKNAYGQLHKDFKTGQSFEYKSRPFASTDFVFPVKNNVETYYFKIYSSKPIVLPFKVLNTKDLLKSLTTKDLIFGLFAGIILVMFLYNLVLYFATKEVSYAYYVSYLIILLVTQLALFGYTDRFLFYNLPELNDKFAVFSGALVAIASVFFVTNFLQLKQKAPLYAKLLFMVVYLDSIAIVILLLDWSVLAFHWVNFTSFYGSIVGIIASIKLTREGFRPAKIFLVAWSLFLISVIVFALVNIGIIPYKPYLHGTMLFGASVEVFLISLALPDRINALRRAREKSKLEVLKIAKENERIILNQNKVLEAKIKERTKEVEEANKELTHTLKNLQKTQIQLVQSEKMASLGVLTAGVAHEINNPLNYILGGHAAILKKFKEKDAKISEKDIEDYLNWIKVGGERASKIVKSLNVYSRSNNDHTESCNLNQIAESCVTMVSRSCRSSIAFNTHFSKNLKKIKGSSSKLHQVILNVLGNAVDAITDTGAITITTTTKQKKTYVKIEDSGIGIPDENIKKVLDPFFTTKAPGKGTGLGLSIVNAIVLEHGGTINFKSQINKGTRVIISFPVLED